MSFSNYLFKPEEYFAYKKDTEIGPCWKWLVSVHISNICKTQNKQIMLTTSWHHYIVYTIQAVSSTFLC